jgi:sugar phosphate permease
MTPLQALDSAAAARPRELKDAPQRWWLVVLMSIGMLICYMHRGALSVAVPFMIKDLGLSTAVAGVLLSAFFWPYAFMQAPAGWAVDRFGVRRVYAWGYALWALAAAALGAARGLVTLAALRALLGVGQSVIFPAHTRAVANWFSERERGTATGIANSGSRLGQAAVNGLGALLIAAIGWRYFFLALGLLPLVWLLPWLLFMKRWDGGAAALDKPSGSPMASFLASFALLKQRSMLGICLGFFCYNYAWILLYTWLPGYLVVERKFSPREMAFFSSIPYLAGFGIALLAGVLADWFVRRGFNEVRVRKFFMTGGMAGACLIVPAGLTNDKLTAVWLLSFAVCSLSISGITTWALTQAVSERQIAGTAGGLQNFSGNIGGIIAPALTGFIAHKTGSFALALGLTGGLLVVGIVIYWLLVAERIKPQPT